MTATIDPPSLASMLPVEMTLIVAATRNMGIGRAGALPWTGLKKEMAYFARVTKRVNVVLPDGTPTRNAIVMGRKTWDSIPERFRPLKGRCNIVLSRSCPPESPGAPVSKEALLSLSSLEDVTKHLSTDRLMGRCFVIGGAEIYKAALERKEAKRILLTRVITDFQCDTFFPITLGEDSQGQWRRCGKHELDNWVGEVVPDGIQDENGIKYVFEMYERA